MPRIRSSFILLLAIGSGLAALVLSMRLTRPDSQMRNEFVAGAIKDIKLGMIIKQDDIDLLPAPTNVNPNVLFTDTSKVIGQTSRRNIPKGEVVRTVDLLSKEDNLASLIPPGYRAMNIPVMLPSNLANLIEVGNRLDVLLTYQGPSQEFQSMTLIKNARVIGMSNPPKGMGGEIREVYISLAVTPDGAQTLAYAMKRGTLNIAVHSLSDEDQTEKFFTLKELFFKAPEAGPVTNLPPKDRQAIELIRGLTREIYSVGGESSDSETDSADEGLRPSHA